MVIEYVDDIVSEAAGLPDGVGVYGVADGAGNDDGDQRVLDDFDAVALAPVFALLPVEAKGANGDEENSEGPDVVEDLPCLNVA